MRIMMLAKLPMRMEITEKGAEAEAMAVAQRRKNEKEI